MFLRRLAIVGAACACASVLAGSTAVAAGEEIVVETAPMTPSSPDQWIDYSVSRRLDAWLVGNATCLKLIDFDEVTGVLTPDAATGMPAVSPDGKTYTFTIAAGHRFEGGPEEAVTAESFKRALERATSPAMAATVPFALPAREFVGAIVGAAAFFDGSAGSISGVQASGNTLTIELLAADPTFQYQLAMPYFCATQSDAPAGYSPGVLASAGPYYVSNADTPNALEHEIVLQRNPNYGGSRLRNLGTIRWVQHGSPLAEDYVASAPPAYSPPAGVTIVPTITTGIQILALNTSKAPFDALNVRQAAAYAVDRTALSAIAGWQATDQFVSPLLPGQQDADVYPLDGSGASTAQSLLGGATPSVTLCHPTGIRATVAAQAKTQLEAVGFQVTLSSPAPYFTAIANPTNCNLAMLNVSPDFPDASRVLHRLFEGGSSTNFSFFNDPTFNARFDAAATMTPESARLAEYADLDADLAYAAPAIAIGHDRRRDAFADRIGCRVLSQALFGYALNRLCIEVESTAPPGGTVSTGAGATPAAPLQTEVAVPSGGTGGTVTITQGQSSETVPAEYTLLEQELDISAPTQTAANPLVFTFELDASVLATAGLTVNEIAIYRNGVPLGNCTGAGATPDPCVASRTTQTDGDGEIVVRTSAASTWGFGERYDVSGGFLSPVKNPPGVNRLKAGGSLPLKFRLGGNEGLDVLAAGSPSSAPAACGTFVPTGPETPLSASSGLSYDATTNLYSYIAKTAKNWKGTCRLLTIHFREGSTLTARFQFEK